MYIWLVVIILICYTVPAMQLVYKNQEILLETGNNDLCYYNYLCAIPSTKSLAFNNIFSNLGYAIFGIAFMIITKIKDQIYHKNTYKDNLKKHNEERKGLPQYFGIYHALGLSLLAEAFLSGCYHVCPTTENFQFDTTFMYVISALMIIKIYQFRHSDVSASAYKVFCVICVVVLFRVLGIYKNIINEDLLWGLLVIMYLFVMMKLSCVLYTSGKWRKPWQDWKNLWKFFTNLRKESRCDWQLPKDKTYLIFVALFDIVNIGMLGFGYLKRPADFFLMVFMGNLFLYFWYYFVMKKIHKEPVTWEAYIYLSLVVLCGMPAAYLFTNKAKTTRKSPAESRDMNQDCLMGMYEGHDIWHFLSAFAIFSFYMLLIVIDDGIDDKARNEIRIF